MTAVVPGDPGSLSAAGALLLRTASAVRSEGAGLRAAYADLGRGWGGHRSLVLRRRGEVLLGAAEDLAATFERVGAALQEHATDLAELSGRARAVADRAALDDLEIRDGRVELAYGVTGEAQADSAAHRDERQVALQGELDLVRTQLARRRGRLVQVLASSGPPLAEAARALGALWAP